MRGVIRTRLEPSGAIWSQLEHLNNQEPSGAISFLVYFSNKYASQERSGEDARTRGGPSILGTWLISLTLMHPKAAETVVKIESQRPIDAELSVYVAFEATST